MKSVVKKLINKVSPIYGKYAVLVWKNRMNYLNKKKDKHKYLFILSPPYCGSTLLNEIVSSASDVSVNNPWGFREGQLLPTVRPVMFDHKRRWDPGVDFDWEYIKQEWMKYWDLSSEVLLEKSPHNIVRAKSIEKNFKPVYFIILHRNPYAHCESLIRRNNHTAGEAANFAIQCLTYQKENLQDLTNTNPISYEELTNNPFETVKLLKQFVPELKDMHYDQKFSAHNFSRKKMKIKNLNNDKIKKLKTAQLKEINSVFQKNNEIIAYWNYSLIA